jgi:hypothetical protein
MLIAQRRYGQQTGLVYNLKGAFVPVIASNTDHFLPPFRPSLLPKPMPIMSNHTLKRRLYVFSPPFVLSRAVNCLRYSDPPTGQSKKSKKNQAKSAAAFALDVGDRATLNRRAERFRREHELEKQKQNGGGGGQASSLRINQRTAHPLVNLSRSATPFANADDPEADPVSALPQLRIISLSHDSCYCHRTSLIGISILLSEHLKRFSKTTYV